jgi:uncharacterized protein YjaZ
MTSNKIISTFENAKDYIKAVEENKENKQEAWQKYMIDPFWPDLLIYTPKDCDLSFMKPAPVENINALKKQIEILSQLSMEELLSKFEKVTEALPKNCVDPAHALVVVALYPACDSDKGLKKRENGVRGCSPNGNVIIRITPLAPADYHWIPYIFAHEYHHGVFGYNAWVNGMQLNGAFYEGMIGEGQADAFAESLFPGLVPQWNRPFDRKIEAELWERLKADPSFADSKGAPWCMGYALGRAIIADFLEKNPDISFSALINIPPVDILNGSRFKF